MAALKNRIIIWLIVVGIPLGLFTSIVIGVMVLGYLQAEEPQEFEATMAQLLGDQVVVDYQIARTDWQATDDYGYQETVESVVEPFSMTYWDGNTVSVSVPGHVWESAVKASQKIPWCDPRLLVALAHSESPHFTNHATENPKGAMGTMQALLGTWNDTWEKIFDEYPNIWPDGQVPSRTNQDAAMLFGCVYAKTTGSVNALVAGKAVFTYFFAQNPPVWNRHVPQAEYIYDLYHVLKSRIQAPATFVAESSQPFQVQAEKIPWHKKLIIDLAIEINLLPQTVYALEDDIGDQEEPENIEAFSASGSCVPLLNSYTIGPREYHTGCESFSYSCNAIKGWDYITADGTPYRAPMNGRITQSGKDKYGNTWMTYRLSNGKVLGIMHLYFPSQSVGSSFETGEIIGLVGDFGLSSTAHGHIWLQENGANLRDQSELFCK